DKTVAEDECLILRHGLRCGRMPGWPIALLCKNEPVESIRRQRQQISELADRRKQRAIVQFNRYAISVFREIKFNRLWTMRDIRNAEDRLVFVFTQIGENLAILRIKKA